MEKTDSTPVGRARIYSARLERYLRAKMQLSEIMYVTVNGDEFIQEPMKETMSRINAKIFCLKRSIQSELGKVIPSDKYNVPSYITTEERKLGVIDITKFPEKEEVHLFDLNESKIISNKNE